MSKEIGKGVPFERIRRLTGYLSGTLDRFNNAKRAEEADRVKHTIHNGNYVVKYGDFGGTTNLAVIPSEDRVKHSTKR